MAEFAYNNAKNTNTSYMLFELNYRYHPRVFYKKNFDFCSKSKSIEAIISELWNSMAIYESNLYHD